MNKFKLLCAAAAIAAPSAAYAQETTATIRGSVTGNGAAIANAEVVVTHVPTGTVSRANTNGEGQFTLTGLRLGGPFTVTTTAPGFQSSELNDLFLQAADPVRLPIELAGEGATATDIIVTGTALSDGGNQSLSPTTTLSRSDIEGVASVNRDVRDLIRRSPFATLDPTNSRATSIAGQNPRFNRFSVNGVQFSDDFGLNNGGLPTSRGPVPLDAICQFSVEVAPVDIQEGDFQGGAINTNLCSGSNTPTGGAFYTYTDDSLNGDEADGTPVALDFDSEAYGVFLRGPIIRDTLFLALAWERTRESSPAQFGPTGGGFANSVPGVTQANIDQVSGIARSLFNFDTGGIVTSAPVSDDRVTARLDWNINDRHNLALTYIYNNGTQFIESGLGNVITGTSPQLTLFSNSYTLSEEVHSGVAQLNSRWSDLFSTEARVSYRDYQRGQTPPGSRDFGQLTVCLDPTNPTTGTGTGLTTCTPNTGRIVFGPDISRQANDLNTENLDVQLTANLLVGRHNFKFLAQYTDQDIYNLFLQRASGAFFFDSLADFQAGRAGSLDLAQSTTGDINGAAAVFDYQTYVAGVQDTWDVTDTLTLVAGIRYEWYDQGSRPASNQFFINRYGFNNQETLNGRELVLPRFGISWRPTPRFAARATFGRFSAGSPDVFISNSFSNTGVTQNRVTFNRLATPPGCTGVIGTGADAVAICNAALNNVFGAGPGIPAVVRNFVASDVRALATAPVNAIDPGFEIPNQFRVAGTISYNADLGPLGDDWFFAFDGLYSYVDQALDYTDLRSVRFGNAPDGRPRYRQVAGVGTGAPSNLQDLLLTNSEEGDSLFLVARFNKEFDFGLSIGASYTYVDVTEGSPITSSVALSNFQNQATSDPNFSTLGIGNEQVDDIVKLEVGFRREFFAGAETRIQFFGEYRGGRPFSYTFNSNPTGALRDPVFGVTGAATRHLIYVPTSGTDPIVFFDTPATGAAFNAFVDNSILAQYRGQIAPKNIGRSDEVFRLDVHVSQDIPIGERLGRIQVFADMENLLNFIDPEWGVIRQFPFPYNAALVNVSCVSATGTPLAGAAVGTCPAYQYSAFREPAQQLFARQSLWNLRLGVRYEF